MAAGPARQMLAEATTAKKPSATADTVIVLWMAGGMAHTEMFDPKRYTPFKKGLDPNEGAQHVSFDRHFGRPDQIRQGLEQMASVMNRGTLIRSYKAGDLGFILHSRHQYQWHTGYAPPQTVAAPHIGAVIARTLGPLNPAVPAFIDIGQRFDLGEGEELKSFHTAGFLGGEFGPFLIPYPDQAASTIRPPKGMSPSRFENRDKFYKRLVKDSPLGEAGSDYQQQSLLRAMDGAHRLLSSPSAKAFDLEPRAEGELRPLQHGPIRPWLSAGPAIDRSRRAVHRSDDRIHPVFELGHARQRPHADDRNEKAYRPADRPIGSRSRIARPVESHADRAWRANSAAT